MLEKIKEHNVLFGVAFALMVVGLLFYGLDQGVGSNNPKAVTVNGTSYTYKESVKICTSYNSLAQELQLLAYSHFLGSGSNAAFQPELVKKQQVLDEAVQQFGIEVSDQAVNTFLKEKYEAFQVDGKFSQEAYNGFVESLKNRGLSEADMKKVVLKNIQLGLLLNVFSGGVIPEAGQVQKEVYSTMQTLGFSTITVNKSQLPEIEITDDELKTFWSENQNQFMSDEKRSLELVYIKGEKAPKAPVAPAEVKEGEKGYKAYQKKAKAYEKQLAKYEAQKATYDESAKALQGKVDGLYDELLAAPDQFATLVKEQGFEVVSLTEVTPSSFPKDLRIPRAKVASRSESFYNLAFEMPWSDNEEFRLSHAYPVSGGGHFIFKLNRIFEPSPLAFEAAKADAKKLLTANKQEEALEAFAKETTEKLETLVKEGKTFEAAATSLSLQTTEVAPFGAQDVSQGLAMNNRDLFFEARLLNVGDFTEPILRGSQYVIAQVTSKEIELSDMVEEQVETMSNANLRIGNQVFVAWFNGLVDQADVTTHISN